MAFRSFLGSKIPLVIVLGATGTGKTKLGVELAQRYGTEIISADSMQIYKGLDVVTAKASRQEREMAKHHLLDILEPNQMFTVVDFRNRALKIIDNLIEQGKMPIVVGGTNYYVESIVYKILVEDTTDEEVLLWDISRKRPLKQDIATLSKVMKIDGNNENVKDHTSVDKTTDESEVTNINESEVANTEHNKDTVDKVDKGVKPETPTDEAEKFTDSAESSTSNERKKLEITKEQLQEDIDNDAKFTNEEIHERLRAIDPVMAARMHPNNRRKIIRSIEVWLKSGRKHSEILAEQKQSEGQLRRPGNTLIFWLKCEQSVHDKRLDDRVDAMLEAGLIEELLDFHARHNKQRIKDGNPPDYTKGIFQTLGFKEFHEYLMLDEETRNTDRGKKLLEQSIENMKIGTRRYARRQNKTIKGRFLEHINREVPPIFELDTTDVSKWDENVKNKAFEIVERFSNNIKCEYEPLKSNISEEKKKIDGNSYNYCDVCERIFIGDNVYALHMKSHRHMKVVKKKKRLEEQKNYELQDQKIKQTES